MKFIIPATLTIKHQTALREYLSRNPGQNVPVWATVYEAIDILANAQVVSEQVTRTFRQMYAEYIERPFADNYLTQLLALKHVTHDSPRITASFARQIFPALQKVNLLTKEEPKSWLLLVYCVYWWQSFAKGYAFEVEIMRDLEASGIDFHMHDIRHSIERFSPADLTVLGLWGDVKTSIYFLQWPSDDQLGNDFYITRLYEKRRGRTLVVFQKPLAWEVVGGETAVVGTLESVLSLLPAPVQIKRRGIILIVADYENWKQLVRNKQLETGVKDE